MRIFVTNDDGIESPGLHALARALHTCGHEVVIVAPARDYSGFGAAIGPLHVTNQVAYEAREIESLVGVEAYAVDGPPGLCAFSSALGGFGDKPDLVVSGINAGANMGRATLFSGTVGAALTAVQFGIPGLAISLGSHGDGDKHWDTAAVCAASLVHAAHANGTNGVLNVNVPNVRPYAVRGMKPAKLAVHGTVQIRMDTVEPGTLELTWERSEQEPDTDVALLIEGYVTLSLIASTRDVEGDALNAIIGQLEASELAG